MPIKLYNYVVSGSAANQSYVTTGTVRCEFHKLFDSVMQSSFRQLMDGKATFGDPKRGSCNGPYDIREVKITQIKPGETVLN